MKQFIENFRTRHPGLWQVVMFASVGLVTSAIDFIIYAICYYVIFRGMVNTEFHYHFLHYDASNGGKAAFISMLLSYAISQVFSFFAQREKTFQAKGDARSSVPMYVATVTGTFILVLWLPTVIGGPLYRLLGPSVGAIAVKLLCQFIPALIQFPLFKWVIMR